MSITDYNRKAQIFTKELPPEAPYIKPADLFNKYGADKIFPLCGMYINTKGRYGDQPVIYTDRFYVNAPSHMLKRCQDLMEDAKVVSDINNGRCGFKIYAYKDQSGKKRHSIEFVNLADPEDNSINVTADDLPF